MSDPLAEREDGNTRYGFDWGPMSVERLATMKRDGGECRVLGLYIEGEPRKQKLEIYVSPTGRSVRVWRDGKELS